MMDAFDLIALALWCQVAQQVPWRRLWLTLKERAERFTSEPYQAPVIDADDWHSVEFVPSRYDEVRLGSGYSAIALADDALPPPPKGRSGVVTPDDKPRPRRKKVKP